MKFTQDDGLDIIFDWLDILLSYDHFEACDELLDKLDLKLLTPALMLGVLCMTRSARHKLKNREAFYFNVEEMLLKDYSREQVADKLGGLL